MTSLAVLIPTYKPQQYFQRCLLSIENQTLSKSFFCVYIVLNGSDKHHEKYINSILADFSFAYKLVVIPESGVSNARNKLIDLSIEPFFTFIDDDDLISFNYLEELLAVTSEEYMGICNIKNFENDTSILKPNYIGDEFYKIENGERSKFKTRKYFSSSVAKMFHRNMVVNARFNIKLALGEDSLFMAEISRNIKGVHKTDDQVYYYVCERAGSATRSKVNKINEIGRLAYLNLHYSKILLSSKSDKLFMLTRIIATIKHLKRVF